MKVRFPSLNIEREVSIDRVNPSVDPLNRTVEIVGVIPNGDRNLKVGMLVEVTFPETEGSPAQALATSAPTPVAAKP
jgi:multidrug efflux pump subunit AcrA (membrane-fusion protein)